MSMCVVADTLFCHAVCSSRVDLCFSWNLLPGLIKLAD